MLRKLSMRTSKRVEFVDITSELRQLIKYSNIKEGIAVVYVLHTTCGVTINEHADPSVASDMIAQLERLIPEKGSYKHLEGNSDAHIKASLFGSSVTIIVENGELLLGTWQGVFLCEFDGPRHREVYVKILGG